MSDFAEGREQLAFVVPETSYGTQMKPTSASGLKILAMGLNYTKERRKRADKKSTRSALGRYFGRWNAEWNLRRYLMTSGSLGVAPDDGGLLKALLGKETVNAGVSVVYEPDSNAARQSLDLYHIVGHIMEGIIGAAVSRAEIRWNGTEEVTIEYTGPAQKGVWAGTDAAANSETTGGNSLQVDNASKYGVGGIIKIGTNDNNGAGFKITAIDYSTNMLTIETNATWNIDDVIAPFLPSPTTTGEPIMGTLVTVSIDGVTLATTEGTIVIDEQIKLINDEAGTDAASAIVTPEERLVNFDFTAYCKKDYFLYHGKALQGAGGDIQIIFGNTSGNKIQIDMDNADYDTNAIDIPDRGEVMLKLTGQAQGSSGDDEIKITML